MKKHKEKKSPPKSIFRLYFLIGLTLVLLVSLYYLYIGKNPFENKQHTNNDLVRVEMTLLPSSEIPFIDSIDISTDNDVFRLFKSEKSWYSPKNELLDNDRVAFLFDYLSRPILMKIVAEKNIEGNSLFGLNNNKSLKVSFFNGEERELLLHIGNISRNNQGIFFQMNDDEKVYYSEVIYTDFISVNPEFWIDALPTNTLNSP